MRGLRFEREGTAPEKFRSLRKKGVKKGEIPESSLAFWENELW